MRWLIGCSLIVLSACSGEPAKPPPIPPTQQELLDDNLRAMRTEAKDIDLYVKRNGLNTVSTGTGVRCAFMRNVEGPVAEPEQLVTVNYRMELLNGTECYSSKPGEPESFRVEHDDVESGLHEAAQLMGVGDSALVIIPSHRAFGLIGDMDKVPMRSTIIYRIGLVKISDTGK